MAITKPTDISGNIGDFCPQGDFLSTFSAGAYTDTALTTEATVDGDLIAGLRDLSGSGNHATQATSGNRPILRLSPSVPTAGMQILAPPDEFTFSTAPTQWLENSSGMLALNRANCSIYVVCDAIRFLANGGVNTWFSHGSTANYLNAMFGMEQGSQCNLAYYGGGSSRVSNFQPHNSREIYHVRASTASTILGMGDDTQTMAGYTTGPATEQGFFIGGWKPSTAGSERRAFGRYDRILVFNRALNDAEHADVIAYLRSAHQVPVYDKLVAMVGYSIWSGFDCSNNRVFWYQLLRQLEAVNACVRVNAFPSRVFSQMQTGVTLLTTTLATVAPFVNARPFKKRVAVLAAATNDIATGSSGTTAFAAWQSLVSACRGLGFDILATTDLDRGAGGSWQTETDIFTGLVRSSLPAGNIVDFRSDVRLGINGASANPRLFKTPGAVHPIETGHGIMAEMIAAKLLPLVGTVIKTDRRPWVR